MTPKPCLRDHWFPAHGIYKVVVVLSCLLYLSSSSATLENASPRRPGSDEDLHYWLENMMVYHGYTFAEAGEATGLTADEISDATKRLNLDGKKPSARTNSDPLRVLPYPGGRHPRIGFLDGAINPQRETKVSVFTPWGALSYVVVDVPEAIFSNLGLTYLAHTHIPTLWDLQDIHLAPLEWQRKADGTLLMERTLPNQITFGTRVVPRSDGVVFDQWLKNGTKKNLSDLHVQNCVMLKMAPGFEAQTNQHTCFSPPYAAIKAKDKNRWIITAFDPCRRVWANPPVPCIHSDPQFADCAPGNTSRIRGWLSFYEGKNITDEFRRLDALGWRTLQVN